MPSRGSSLTRLRRQELWDRARIDALDLAGSAGRPGLPIWFDALGSLNKEVVLAHERFIPDIEKRLVETQLPSLTFDSLCRRHEVRAIDVLHTDTEGSDYNILRSIDFERLRPK